jgi:hypothetical protein
MAAVQGLSIRMTCRRFAEPTLGRRLTIPDAAGTDDSAEPQADIPYPVSLTTLG